MRQRPIYVPTMWQDFTGAKEAYREGFRAKQRGEPLTTNPHPRRDLSTPAEYSNVVFDAWNAGWRKAELAERGK